MATKRNLRLALCQMSVAAGDIAANAARAEKAIREAAAGGAATIALPEMWATGFDFSRMAEYRASDELRGLEARMGDLAAELGVEIAAGSWLHFAGAGRPTNRAHFFDARGRHIAHYDKTHLFAPMAEDRFLAAGNGPEVFVSALGRAAMAICYDLRFDDIFAAATRTGCEAVLLCAAWPVERVATMVEMARSRARANGCTVVAVNCASPEEAGPLSNGYVAPRFGGRSCVFGPEGGELFVAPERDEGVFFVEIGRNR